MFHDNFVKNIVAGNIPKEEKRDIFQKYIREKNIPLLQAFERFCDRAMKIYEFQPESLSFLLSDSETISEFGKYGVGEAKSPIQAKYFTQHGGIEAVSEYFGVPQAYIYFLIEKDFLKRRKNGKYNFVEVENAFKSANSIQNDLCYLLELSDPNDFKALTLSLMSDYEESFYQQDALLIDAIHFTEHQKNRNPIECVEFELIDDGSKETAHVVLDILNAKYQEGYTDGSKDIYPKAYNEGYNAAKQEMLKIINKFKMQKK